MSCTLKALAALLVLCSQDKKEPPKPPTPRVAMAIPLGVISGATTKVTIRGLNLDQTTEVRFAEPVEGATVVVKSKGKAAMPKEVDAAVYGDTQVELEVKLSASVAAGKIALVIVNPAGETGPHELPVTPADRWVAEKEPNGGFVAAQPLEAGRTVEGSIAQALDVDVFRIAGKAGERWIFEVVAQRRGSVLDPMLSLHAEGGRLIATRDDDGTSRDATLAVTVPADGAYYLTLIDAHNQGGATHVYRLEARREP